MQCPYCSQEMKTGVIQARAAWFAEKARLLGPREADVSIVQANIWGTASSSPACYCEACKKVIISLNEDELSCAP